SPSQRAPAASVMAVGVFGIRMLDEEHPYALMIYLRGTPPDELAEINRETVQHPAMMVASDGMYHGISAHPRAFGCFAAVLRRDVRETGAVRLEEAVRKMSGYPAERNRIRDRGLLKEGYGADVVIFDPETVADQATWDEPRLEPVGIDQVIVNGRTVVDAGAPTDALPGRVLRR